MARSTGARRGTAAPARKPLTRERIAGEALRLIDRDGLADLSTRKLGRELGCEAMSIYHHYPNKAALLDGVAELLLASVRFPSERSGDWLARIRRISMDYTRLARTHPHAFILLATRRFNTPPMLSFLERVLAIFRAEGFDAGMSARLFRVIGHYLNGAALAAITVRQQIPDAPDTVMIDHLPDVAQFPFIAEAAQHLGAAYLDTTFESGLDMLLAAVAAAPRRTPGRTAKRRR